MSRLAPGALLAALLAAACAEARTGGGAAGTSGAGGTTAGTAGSGGTTAGSGGTTAGAAGKGGSMGGTSGGAGDGGATAGTAGSGGATGGSGGAAGAARDAGPDAADAAGDAPAVGAGAGTPVQRAPAVAVTPRFWPPVPRPAAISSTFGPRWKGSAGRYDFHPGIDWYDALGTEVTAIGDGTVQAVYPEGSTQYPNGGNTVVVRHDLDPAVVFHGQSVTRLYAVYLHLQGFAVAAGDAVTRGQVVGTMGSTGDTTFVHLHFELRLGTSCSLQFQTANPTATCVTGWDPHVHPFLFVGGQNTDVIRVEEIPPEPGKAWAVRYTATRGDLDLDVIETDHGRVGFCNREGLDATTLTALDDFDRGWLHLVPQPFTSSSTELVMDLHFTERPAYLELLDVWGVGVRY